MKTAIFRRETLIRAAVAFVAMTLATGCPKPKDTKKAGKSKQQVHIKSFSDASPVRLLAAARPYLFSASGEGLDRWNLETGDFLTLNVEHGLSGERVLALAHDASRGWLWVATDGGMTKYDVAGGTFSNVPKPPSVLGLDSFRKAVMAPANDGGLWVAHKRGLFYTNANGKWNGTGITEPVSAVLQTRSGWLWFGTREGLIGRQPDGESFRFGEKQGCDITNVRIIAEAPGGSPIMVGENADGDQRIALILNDACASYSVGSDQRILSVSRHASELILMTNKHFFSMGMPGGDGVPTTVKSLPFKSLSVGGNKPPPLPFSVAKLDVRMPARPLAFTAVDDELFVATRFQGTARASIGASSKRKWLRRGDIVEGAKLLSVACRERDDCFMGTAGRYAWHYDGTTFRKVDVDGTLVQAFVRSSSGQIFALVRRPQEQAILAYRYQDSNWVEAEGIRVETPEGLLQLRCARISPTGLLWLGLEYQDETGEFRSHGTAVVDLDLSITVYHRESASKEDAATGVIPIPIGVVDLAFLGQEEVWVASTEGAARVRGENVEVFSEAHGLESEFLRGIAVTPGGIVFAASGRGIAQYDGKYWSIVKALKGPTNDNEMGPDGRLWLATDDGVKVYDGAKVRILDSNRGLLQNEIEEIRVDYLGRMWARGSEGVTIITP